MLYLMRMTARFEAIFGRYFEVWVRSLSVLETSVCLVFCDSVVKTELRFVYMYKTRQQVSSEMCRAKSGAAANSDTGERVASVIGSQKKDTSSNPRSGEKGHRVR